MWLTVIFPDLCICLYILTYTPRMAPAHPLLIGAIACIMQGHDVGENGLCLTFHRHTEGIHQIKHLLVYDNCYAISCHHLWCKNWGSFHIEDVLQSRCTFYPTPIEDGHATYPEAVHSSANGQLKCPTLDVTIYKVYDKYATQMVT